MPAFASASAAATARRRLAVSRSQLIAWIPAMTAMPAISAPNAAEPSGCRATARKPTIPNATNPPAAMPNRSRPR
jgi:hypothetical protein